MPEEELFGQEEHLNLTNPVPLPACRHQLGTTLSSDVMTHALVYLLSLSQAIVWEPFVNELYVNAVNEYT